MATPAFTQRGGLTWTQRGPRAYEARSRDVAFVAEAPWYAPKRWTVRGTSALALPLDVTIYVAHAGSAHGYWSNVSVAIRSFWDEPYFAYCSLPALMPLLVGAHTQRAIAAHDDARASEYSAIDEHPRVVLHVRARTIETTTVVDASHERVIDDQLAIHRGLAADHAALLEDWRDAATALGGTVASSWPPVIDVPRPHGSTTIALQWSSSERRGAPASIELSVDARHAPVWTMEQQAAAIPNGTAIGGQVFLVTGNVPIDVEQLGPLVSRAQLVSIVVRRNVIVRIARSSPDAAVFEELLGLLARLCGPGEPYR